MQSKPTIDFYLDFTSPYAYLASTQIDALADQYGYAVIWRPFLVGATFKVTGRKAPVKHPLLREYMFEDVYRFARLLKQPLNFPVNFPILSVKASRLFYAIEQRDQNQRAAKAFAGAVYKAYFVDSQDINDSRVLAEIAVPFGLDKQQMEEAVNSPEMKVLFKQEVEQAIGRGVFGVPMFIVDEQMFWGADRLSQLQVWLETGGW